MSIEEYIKHNEKFSRMPFVTIYTAIMELINDGYIEQTAFEKAGDSGVEVCEQKSKEQVRRGLHCQGDCHCHWQCVG